MVKDTEMMRKNRCENIKYIQGNSININFDANADNGIDTDIKAGQKEAIRLCYWLTELMITTILMPSAL